MKYFKSLLIFSFWLFLLSCKHQRELPFAEQNSKNDTSTQIKDPYELLIEKDTLKCNVLVLVPINESLQKKEITEEQIRTFYKTYDKLCHSNVEYSEFTDGLLLEIIRSQPKFSLEILENEKEHFDTEYIIETLKHPLFAETSTVKDAYSKISKLKSNSSIKAQVLASLDTALVYCRQQDMLK